MMKTVEKLRNLAAGIHETMGSDSIYNFLNESADEIIRLHDTLDDAKEIIEKYENGLRQLAKWNEGTAVAEYANILLKGDTQ